LRRSWTFGNRFTGRRGRSARSLSNSGDSFGFILEAVLALLFGLFFLVDDLALHRGQAPGSQDAVD